MIGYHYLPSAREDLNDAAAFYESRVPGLGAALLDDVERALGLLRERPGIGVPAGRGFRKAMLRRFPFSLIYTHSGNEIVVVAVSHHRRRPGYWRRNR